MSDMTNQLDAVNTEIAKQLAGCEDSLRVIAQEYNAWTQTSMFAALDSATKAQVENAVRTYVASNTERIRVARAGFDALRSIAPSAAPGQSPLASLGVPAQDPLAAMSPAAPAQAVPEPAVRLGRAEGSMIRRPAPEAEAEQAEAEIDDSDFVSVAEPAEEAPPPAQAPLPGGSEGRPRPRPSSAAPAPVRNQEGFTRASGPDSEEAPIGRRVVRATRQHSQGASVRPVSQDEMLTGERADGVVVGPPDADQNDVITSGRSLSPNADFDNAAQAVRQRQRRHMATQKAEAASGSARPIMREAEILDGSENTIGRAIGIRRHEKQIMVDQIELYLEDMEGEWGDGDAPSMLRAIVKSKNKWVFQGAKRKIENMMVAHANVCGFDEADDNVLVLKDVGLAAGVQAPVGR